MKKKYKIQDIANRVGTSRTTVWKALNGKPGVSEALKMEIEKAARDMRQDGKEIAPVPSIFQNKTSKATIAIAVSRLESTQFWLVIVQEIARYLGKLDVNLIYIYLPGEYRDDFELSSVLYDGTTQGMIVLNTYSQKILRLLSTVSLPKVFLDIPSGASPAKLGGDLLLIEGFHTVYAITQDLVQKKYLRLGFIGDTQYALTNMDRYRGFLKAMEDNSLPVESQFLLTTSFLVDTHYEQITEYLDQLPEYPDAFVCVSDFIAHFVKRYFLENKKISLMPILTGFDNSKEYDNVASCITTAEVYPKYIARMLVNKVLFTIQNPQHPYEISYITSKPIFR